MRVEGKFAEMHLTPGGYCQPLREGDPAVRVDPYKAVGHRDLVEVGIFAVEKESVWAPDFVQKLPVHYQLTGYRGAIVHQPLIIPRTTDNMQHSHSHGAENHLPSLSEVTIQSVSVSYTHLTLPTILLV